MMVLLRDRMLVLVADLRQQQTCISKIRLYCFTTEHQKHLFKTLWWTDFRMMILSVQSFMNSDNLQTKFLKTFIFSAISNNKRCNWMQRDQTPTPHHQRGWQCWRQLSTSSEWPQILVADMATIIWPWHVVRGWTSSVSTVTESGRFQIISPYGNHSPGSRGANFYRMLFKHKKMSVQNTFIRHQSLIYQGRS